MGKISLNQRPGSSKFAVHVLYNALVIFLLPHRLNIITLEASSGPPARLILFLFTPGDDFESSLLSFEKLDRASPDLWPEQRKLTSSPHSPPSLIWNQMHCFHVFSSPFAVPGVAEFAASYRSVSRIHLDSLQACVPQTTALNRIACQRFLL